jgi:hypothetical protein
VRRHERAELRAGLELDGIASFVKREGVHRNNEGQKGKDKESKRRLHFRSKRFE